MTETNAEVPQEVEPDLPWRDDDDRPLATLLNLAQGPGSSNASCVWFLGRLDVDHPDVRIAAWRVARASMRQRCGATSAYEDMRLVAP
jgi:hypothetical protein